MSLDPGPPAPSTADSGMSSPAASPSALALRAISKAYPGVQALRDVDLEVLAGEVHALVGENGAGKSTLMGVAAGSVEPDAGQVWICGTPLTSADPALSRELGVAIVYQTPALLPDLSVAENFYLGMPSGARPRMGELAAATRAALQRVSLVIDPGTRVARLTVAQRHLLEIAKALAARPQVLILDEPTEPLGREEVERLFATVRELAGQGIAVVYISHRLPDVRRIADRITVLRDGQSRGTFAANAVSEDDIVRLIVGRPVDLAFPPKAAGDAQAPRLELAGFSGDGFAEVTASIHAGQIVGLAGVEGNGQREFIRALAGLQASEGELRLDGRRLSLRSPRGAAHAGMAFMPADRHRESLLMAMSVRENAALLSLPEYAQGGFVNRRREASAVRDQVSALDVRTPSLETSVGSLSGGNQQKVVLARSLLAEPSVLLADEPTQGVDAGSRLQIYRVLRSSAEQGAAVVVLCSDGIELEGLCDRVLVFSRGQVVRELTGPEVTEENIAHAALTATRTRAHREHASGGRWASRFLGRSEYAPAAILALFMLVLGAYTASRSGNYLTSANFQSYFLLLSALGFIALGQFIVVMLGGIDLSVGPLSGFLLVLSSFIVTPGGVGLWIGALALLGAAIAVGLTNGLLIRAVRINPVVATLVTYFVLQGLSLLLRPTTGGEIDEAAVRTITTIVGWVPISVIVLAVLAIVLEVALRRTRWGLQLRAVGSDEAAAHRLGMKTGRVYVAAYVACAVLTFCGGVMLMAQLGTGDPNAGVNYTLTSIAAVVLGGASIFGGRGAFVGALLGAALLQQITNVTPFLNLGQAWQYWLPGALTLIAAAVYSRARKSEAAS
jgi:ribose transport system permease protein/ribose transport system ATP-binding protein